MRLIDDMRREAMRQHGLCAGYRMTGDHEPARQHMEAATALEAAAQAMERLER